MIVANEHTTVPDCKTEDNLPFVPVSGGGSETPESIKTKYESNPNTNAFTDALKSGLETVISWISVNGTNLLNHIGIVSGNPHGTKFSDLSDAPTSLPASDVYSWAKSDTKPTYTASEVGAEPAKGADDNYVSAAEKVLMLTEQTKFVLSALDAQITIGQKAKDTVKVKHQITASDISNDLTVAPQNFDIILDIKKNGTSIFSTKPKITAGQLVLDGNHALTTSPTIFNVGETKTIHIDQTGFGETGQNLNLYILTHKIL